MEIDFEQALGNMFSYLQKIKEELVKEEGPDEGTLAPFIDVIRGGKLRFRGLFYGEGHVSEMLTTCTAGLRADVVVMAFEGFTAMPDTVNPDTGNPWSGRQIHAYIAEHGRNGLVGESINGFVMGHEGALFVGDLPFHYDKNPFGNLILAWGEPRIRKVPPDHARGTSFYEAIAAGFEQMPDSHIPDLLAFVQAEMTTSDEGAHTVLDCSFVKSVMPRQLPDVSGMLLAEEDELERRRIIETLLGRPMSRSFEGAMQVATQAQGSRWN